MTEPHVTPGRPRALDIHPASLIAVGFTCALFLLFAGGVRVVAAEEASRVAALDGRIGEVVAQEARAQWRAGDAAAALALFERALSLPFDDPRQRAWRAEEFGRLLMTGPRHDTAVRFATMLAPHEPATAERLMLMLHKRLMAQDRPEDALDAARAWRESLGVEERPALAAHAMVLEGHALYALGRVDEAAGRYLAAHETHPTVAGALAGARALSELGRDAEARPLVAFVEAAGEPDPPRDAPASRNRAN
jgi:tetratricopeptide (TPR) repeat protein